MADRKDSVITGIDIGSHKTVCIIAQSFSERDFRIEGVGVSSSKGTRNGTVVQIGMTIDAVREAVAEAEKSAGVSISKVVAGISGDHIRSDNADMTVVTHRNEVEQSDVDEMIQNIQANSLIAPSMRYLTVIPQEYAVDYTWGIHQPVGLEGKRLDGKFHVVTAQSAPCQNVSKALRRSGLELIDNMLEFNPLASAKAVITPEEKRLGVLVLDIGSNLLDVALYYDDAIQYTRVYPVGGDELTNEISIKTQLSQMDAESLKRKMGQVKFDPAQDPSDSYELPIYAGFSQDHARVLTRQALSAVIDAKVGAILEWIYQDLREAHQMRNVGHGIVITGGGAELRGIDRMVREIFSQHRASQDINVRIGRPVIDYETKMFYAPERFSKEGYPQRLDGLSKPEYATVMGYIMSQNLRNWESQGHGGRGMIKGFKNMVKSWFVGNF